MGRPRPTASQAKEVSPDGEWFGSRLSPSRDGLEKGRFFLDMGMRWVSNACSGEPGEVPSDEVNAHLGNPG
jgi:hypothetical protein